MTTPMRARSLAQASLHGHAYRVTYLLALDVYPLTINADDDRSCAVTPSRSPC